MGLNGSTVDTLRSLYEGQQAAVRVESEITDWFTIGKGVCQGCLISPLSFNCYSENVMRESVDEFTWIGVTVSGRTINDLRYADDIVLIATSQEALQALINKLSSVLRKYGLEINTKKTKVLVASTESTVVQVTCDNTPLEQVQSYRYLDSIITETSDCRAEIIARLWTARSAAKSLTSLWKDRSLNPQLKCRLMQTLVWSVAMYGCESWTVKAADSKRLNAFEMDMYRRMMRISWREHRTNNSITEELQPTCRFLAEVKRRKLQYEYFGHVVRADDLCTHILHVIIAGNRRRGRPWRQWTDDIKQWTGIPVADCVQRARDRSMWRSLVSVSVTSDPQTWGRTYARQGNMMLSCLIICMRSCYYQHRCFCCCFRSVGFCIWLFIWISARRTAV